MHSRAGMMKTQERRTTEMGLAPQRSSRRAIAQLSDNRPETVAQQKLQAMMNASAQGFSIPTNPPIGNGNINHPTAVLPGGVQAPHKSHAGGGFASVQRQTDMEEGKTEAPFTEGDIEEIPDISPDEVETEKMQNASPEDIAQLDTLVASLDVEPWAAKLQQQYVDEKTPLEILGQQHYVEYRSVGGEWVAGVASTWIDVFEIYQDFRRNNLLDGTAVGYYGLVREMRAERREWAETLARTLGHVNRYREQVKAIVRGRRRSPAYVKGKRPGESSLTALMRRRDHFFRLQQSHSRSLGQARREEQAAIRVFIHYAAGVDGLIVAEILGANLPLLAYETDADAADGGAVRYHTGTAGDPIPLVWYKPLGDYKNITVNDYSSAPPTLQVLDPFAVNPSVSDSLGNNYTFGVQGANQPGVNTTWQNLPKHGKARTTQQGLNGVLFGLGYNLSTNGEDGDHVRDLGFGGNDVIDNYWPLDSTINRYAFTGWRTVYLLNFKDQYSPMGHWTVRKAALNSGFLATKYFIIKGFEATDRPVENNTRDAGSDTGHGTADQIRAQDGSIIAEG